MRHGHAALLLSLVVGCGPATYSGEGDVVAVDEPRTAVVIRHGAIEGLTGAATTRLPVRGPEVLAGVRPGMRVGFQVVAHGARREVVLLAPAADADALRPGRHDHTPHHGGVVAMVGRHHLEAIAFGDGRVRVYLSDRWRRPVPLAGVTGTVTFEDHRSTAVALTAGADALEAGGPAPGGRSTAVTVRIARAPEALEARFVLPLDRTVIGAGGVPPAGCVPVAPVAGRRQPRCAIMFARPVIAVAATPDAATAVVAVLDQGLTAWRLPAAAFHTGFEPPPTLHDHGDGPPRRDATTAMATSPDGTQVAVGFGRMVLRYATATGRLLAALPSPGGLVRDLAWSPDGERLLVAVRLLPGAEVVQAADGAGVRRLAVERAAVAVAFAADGQRAAVAGEGGSIAVYDLARRPPSLLSGPAQAVVALAFLGERLLAITAGGVLRVWDPLPGAIAVAATVPARVRCAALAPGTSLAAVGGADGRTRLYDLGTGQVVDTLAWHARPVNALAWAHRTLLAGDGAGQVALWDLADLS